MTGVAIPSKGLASPLSLAGRISAISAVWLVGLAIVVGAGVFGYRALDADQAATSAAARLAIEAERARASATALMAGQRDFLIEPSAEGAATLRALVAETGARVATLRAEVADLGIDPAPAETLQRMVADLDASFLALVDLQTRYGLGREEGLIGALNATGEAVRSQLNKVSKSGQNPATVRVVAAFAQMGQARAEYLHDHGDVARGAFDAAATRMQRQLAAAEIDETARAGLDAAVTAHFEAFARIAEIGAEIERAEDGIALAFDLVGPATRAVLDGAEASAAAAGARLEATRQLVGLVVVVAATLTTLLGFLVSMAIGRSVTRPLGRLVRSMGDLAAGKAVTVTDGERGDEIGRMARALAVFADTAGERTRLAAEAEATAAARLDRQRVVEAAVAAFRLRAEDLTTAVEATMDDMQTTAVSLADVAERSALKAGMASASAGAAAGKVVMVSASTEELAGSIGEIATQVARTTAIVAGATADARATNGKVAGLAAAASKVGEVVTLIQSIAQQTNLLALNATIEAARAGAAGRGFAVVASEVKALATQTAEATGQIGDQIAAIQASTADAVASIQAIARVMEEANGTTAAIAAAVEQQGAATEEISRNVQDASTDTRMVSETITDVSVAVGETMQSAEAVGAAASQVSERTRDLKVAIEDFMQAVAA